MSFRVFLIKTLLWVELVNFEVSWVNYWAETRNKRQNWTFNAADVFFIGSGFTALRFLQQFEGKQLESNKNSLSPSSHSCGALTSSKWHCSWFCWFFTGPTGSDSSSGLAAAFYTVCHEAKLPTSTVKHRHWCTCSWRLRWSSYLRNVLSSFSG